MSGRGGEGVEESGCGGDDFLWRRNWNGQIGNGTGRREMAAEQRVTKGIGLGRNGGGREGEGWEAG